VGERVRKKKCDKKRGKKKEMKKKGKKWEKKKKLLHLWH
jgi:hypothetical protein